MNAVDRTKFWRDHIAQMLGQDKTVRAYAAEQGLKLSTVQWWRRKLREADRREIHSAAAGGQKLVAVRVTTTPTFADSTAVSLSGAAVTIRMGQITRIELGELPPVQWLAALQRALEERR